MFCKNCGKELDDSAAFCPACGVPTDNFKAEAAPAPVAEAAPVVQTEVQPVAQPVAQPVVQPQVASQPVYTAIPVQPKRVNGLGIAGFVVSIVSLWLGMYFCIVSLIALGLSIASMALKKKYNSCNGLAIAGLVISIISTALWLFVWLIVVAVMGTVLF